MGQEIRRFGSILAAGLARGLRTGWLLVRIILPLSAAVALLQWLGILGWIGARLAPIMGLFGLPGEAAVALVSGFFVGVYGGVAAAAVIPMTGVQLTVLALMILVAHNLVVESAVQFRSGASGLKITAVRLATATVLGAIAWQILRLGEAGPVTSAYRLEPVHDGSFAAFAVSWAHGSGVLALKIVGIILALSAGTEILRAYGAFARLARPLRPIMLLLGLPERVSLLWLTATFLGISYGAGLIIQDAQESGRFQPGDLRDLHVSIGISHSLLEDTLLFVAIGASPLWILLPRPLAAAAVVRIVRRLAPGTPVGAPATENP